MDQSDPHYAVMRTIRITSMQHAYWVGAHNSREMVVPNLEPGAAPVTIFVGTADVRADLQAAHDRFKPKAKDGAVLGLEFVFSASREAFDGLSPRAKHRKALRLLWRVRKFLRKRYPHEGQIVSIVLHEDERTPHIHVVVIPVHWRVDKRAGEREYFKDEVGKRKWRLKEGIEPQEEWMLSAARDMGGKGRLAQHQSDFAKIVEDIGLSRGRHRSGGRNISNREHEALLAAAHDRAEQRAAEYERQLADLGMLRVRHEAKAALDEVTIAGDQDEVAAMMRHLDGRGRELEHDRAVFDVEAERQRQAAQDLVDAQAKLDAEQSAFAVATAAQETDLAARRDATAQGEAALDERSRKAKEWEAGAKKRADRLNEEIRSAARQERAIAKRELDLQYATSALDERSEAVTELADVAVIAISYVDMAKLPAELRPRVYAIAEEFNIALAAAADRDVSIRELARGRTAGTAASRRA